MSNMIEKEVVKMEFDNSDFEKKTKESMSTIEKLKKALNFDTAKETLSNFAKQANELDFNGLKESVDTVAKRFSNLGIVGMTVISRLTNAMVDGVSKIAHSISGMIVSGGISRAMNIERAKFQLEGLGIAWDDIKEDIDYGVKDTAYGLDAAASAAAQLSASGVQIGEDMKQSLRAISGVASMTGSTYEEIAAVFEAAAGNGRVMAGELRRLSDRGVNAAAVLGKALGKTEAEIREMASDGQIDFATFAKAMDDAFGQHAKDANKTLNGTLDNIRSAWSRIGAEFVQPIIRNEGELVGLLNAYRKKINDIKEAIIPVAETLTTKLNAILASITRTIEKIDIKERVKKVGESIKSLINSFEKLFNRIAFVGRKIGEVYREIFPKKESKNILDSFNKIIKAIGEFNVNNKTIEKIQSIFRGLFSIVKVGVTVFKNLLVVVKPIFKYIVSEAGRMLDIAAFIGDAISKFTGQIKNLDNVGNVTAKLIESLETIKWTFEDIARIIKGEYHGLQTTAEKICGIITDVFYGAADAVVSLIEAITGLDLTVVHDKLYNLYEDINDIYHRILDRIDENGGGIRGIVVTITEVLDEIATKITEFIKKYTGIDLSALKDKIFRFFNTVEQRVSEFASKTSILEKIGNGFTFVKDRIKELSESLTGLAKSASIGLGKLLENPVGSFVSIKGASAVIDTLRQLARDGALGGFATTLNSIRQQMTTMMASMNARTILSTAAAIVALGYALKIFAGGIAEIAKVPKFENTMGSLTEMLIAMGGLFLGLKSTLHTIAGVNFKGDSIVKPIEGLKNAFALSAGKILVTSVLVLAVAESMKILVDALVEIAGLDTTIGNHITACIEIFGLLVLLGEALRKLSTLKPAKGLQGSYFLIYAGTFVIIAEAVKIMAEAFATLNSEMLKINDIGDLVDSLLSFGIILGMMATLVYSLNKIKITNVQNLVALGIGIFAIAEGVSVLVKAIKIVKDLDAAEALMGLVTVFTLLQAVMRGAYLLAGSAISIKTSVALIAIATAVAVLTHEINVLAKTPILSIIKGFAALIGILSALTITASLFMAEMPGVKAAGFAMIEFAAAIWIITKSIQNLARIPIDTIAERLAVLLGSVVAFAWTLKTFKMDNATAGLGLLEVAAAVWILAQAINALALTNPADILKSGVSLIVFLGTLAAIAAKMTLAVAGAQAMLILAAAIGVLAISIKLLADTKGWMIGTVVTLGLFMAGLAALGAAATTVGPIIHAGAIVIAGACAILAAGLLAVTVVVTIFAASMAIIAVSGLSAADGLKAFATALIELTIQSAIHIKTMLQLTLVMKTAAEAFATAGLALIAFGVGLVAFGAGAAVAGVGATVLAGGLLLLAEALEYLITVLQAANLDSAVTTLGLNTGKNYAESTAKGINQGTASVKEAITNLIKNAIVGSMDKQMGIASPSKLMAEKGMFIDMGLAEGINNNQDLVRKASENLGTTASTSLNTALLRGTNEGSKTLSDSVKKFDDIAAKGSMAAGVNVGAGFMKGLQQIAPRVKAYAANLGKSAYMAMKQYLKIKSPSRLMMELGEYTGEGFVIGMQNTETSVEDSAQDLGKTASDSLTTALSAAYDNLTSGIEDPTIKPVLDLSEIQNGASNIDSMLSRDFASNISANYRSDRDYADEQTQANASLMSGLNDRLVSALMANGGSDLPINLNVQLVGDAAGVFRLVMAENQRMTNMYGSSPLMRG